MVTICSLVARAGGSEDQQVQAMADRMVEYASQCMENKNRVSPFESAFFSQVHICAFPFGVSSPRFLIFITKQGRLGEKA